MAARDCTPVQGAGTPCAGPAPHWDTNAGPNGARRTVGRRVRSDLQTVQAPTTSQQTPCWPGRPREGVRGSAAMATTLHSRSNLTVPQRWWGSRTKVHVSAPKTGRTRQPSMARQARHEMTVWRAPASLQGTQQPPTEKQRCGCLHSLRGRLHTTRPGAPSGIIPSTHSYHRRSPAAHHAIPPPPFAPPSLVPESGLGRGLVAAVVGAPAWQAVRSRPSLELPG
mmetsp:Transcript_24273/g.43834  ORF Transcript_24273/g.43834 Transcript_24273/m.43834 type:complete len:224 (+) Transcript_24273:274-945(+)